MRKRRSPKPASNAPAMPTPKALESRGAVAPDPLVPLPEPVEPVEPVEMDGARRRLEEFERERFGEDPPPI